ncbi:MAG: four helix bundle protein, partial [Chlorobiales bacterium]|nr:four helix bundle protein [Chlorobiales bacterium]
MMSHQDLIVWQKSLSFVEGIYAFTRSFPDEEKYGLTSQLKRASVSIPSNISEGAARQGKKEFEHFLFMALGSVAEVETQLELARRLSFASDSSVALQHEKITEIRRLLQGTIRHLKSAPTNK